MWAQAALVRGDSVDLVTAARLASLCDTDGPPQHVLNISLPRLNKPPRSPGKRKFSQHGTDESWLEWIYKHGSELTGVDVRIMTPGTEPRRRGPAAAGAEETVEELENGAFRSVYATRSLGAKHAAASLRKVRRALKKPRATVNLTPLDHLPALAATMNSVEAHLGRSVVDADVYISNPGSESYG